MNTSYHQLWKAFVELSLNEISNKNEITINSDLYPNFVEEFKRSYNLLKTEYMSNEVVYLDRHKVAAVIVLSFIKVKPLKCTTELKNATFVGNYKIALSVALSYMGALLNQHLLSKDMQRINEYLFPDTMNSTGHYLDVLIRQLYLLYNNKNPNDIEILFFLSSNFYNIEVYTLTKLNIDYFPD